MAGVTQSYSHSNQICINILCRQRLASEEEAIKFVNLITDEFPFLTPQKYGNYEPLPERFDVANRLSLLDSWRSMFIWARTKPKMEGTVGITWAGERPTHGSINVSIETTDRMADDVIKFVHRASCIFDADFASIHRITMQEVAAGPPRQTIVPIAASMGIEYDHSMTTWDLVKFVPDLYWATLFGEPYVTLFGRELLLQSPAPIVKELPNGSIYIQLSDSPFDLDTDYGRVNGVRDAVKSHLNHNAFYDRTKPRYSKYNTPHFQIEGYTDEDMAKWHGSSAPENHMIKLMKAQGTWIE